MSSTITSTGSSKPTDNTVESHSFDRLAAEIRELSPYIHPPIPNPAPLGLFAFGLTTALLQVKHTGLAGDTEEDGKGTENLVWGYAIFFGGLLQIIAGIVEVKRNNIFGFTAFTTYGGFWLSLAAAHVLIDDNAEVLFSSKAVQAMLVMMGVFTFVLWICTLKMNATISLLFFLLASTFFLLAVGVDDERVDKAAGWVGMATAATAYWLASAELINDIIGKGHNIIPLGVFESNSKHRFSGAIHVPGRTHGETHRQALKGTRMSHLRRSSILHPKGEGEKYWEELDLEAGSERQISERHSQ